MGFQTIFAASYLEWNISVKTILYLHLCFEMLRWAGTGGLLKY